MSTPSSTSMIAIVISLPWTARATAPSQILYGFTRSTESKAPIKPILSDLPVDDGGGPDPAAAAHRLQPVAEVAPLQLVQQVVHEPRAGSPERVPDRNRAAVDVHLLGIGAGLLEPGQGHAREGLFALEEVVVLERRAPLLEHRRRTRDRPLEHEDGIAPDDRLGKDAGPRLEAQLLGLLARPQEAGPGAPLAL